ncbi:LysR family transcriptional regulator [Massilia sp. ST3]|uniref:LysR family transcriptional regulator n=1 Tax=Massilia sp. ST3 TaxID=2824903 RepID=UPI001B812737|nr:LysR family transcriptional regulator [Massilia sp. ST3]
MINYKHLQYFHVVATTGTVARAAQQLHVSAQAISTQLQVLESQLGEELFRKKGRLLELTEAGKIVLQYAEQIFSIGNELEQAIRRGVFTGAETLRVGICDVIPKAMAFRLLQPAREAGLAMRLVCREGRFADLVQDLSAHRLDLVISDQGLPPGGTVRGHTHLLGSSAVAVVGHPELCGAWQGTFPQRLKGAPFLMPGQDATLHSQLKGWLESQRLRPIVVGEFDDGALLMSFAGAGAGFIAVPAVLADAVCAQYGLERAGTVEAIVEQFYAVTVERRVDHPALQRILDRADELFVAGA